MEDEITQLRNDCIRKANLVLKAIKINKIDCAIYLADQLDYDINILRDLILNKEKK